MVSDIRILWHSVAPWAGTGYGTQTGVFAPRIKALGHDLAISAYYGLQGAEMSWKGIKCYPAYNASYGADVIVPHALDHFGAGDCRSLEEASTRGVIITLGDVWTFDSPLLEQLCVGSWVPVDHLNRPPWPVPEVVSGWFGVMGAIPIAMSRFGEAALRDAGLNPLYVPHGIELGTFCPGDKEAARAAVGLPGDAFVVDMVANNIGKDGNRKAFAESIAAFAQLRKKHSDAMLILHTDVDSPAGMRLRSFLQQMLPDRSYTYTDIYTYRKGISPAGVARIYQAADVHLQPSWGEGFGVPIVEAQACGTPVIVTDATSMPELCGSGWKVPYEEMWHDSAGGWAAKPLIAGIAGALEQAYEKARDESMRAEAWAFAQNYGADEVLERYWVPALARFGDVLERRRADLDRRSSRKTLPVQIREADGLLWIDRGNTTGDGIGWKNHETQLQPILEDLLPDGGVLLDVGAHVGHWALRLAAKASKVIAVEANPATAATLRRHLAMNDITNVTVIELAAWDEDAWLRLEDPNGQIEGGSTRTLPAGGENPGTVPASRLDASAQIWNAVLGTGRLDLVKLDVEGADIRALKGMAGLLEKYAPALFIECHDIYGYYTREDLERTLTGLGYVFEVAASMPSQWMPDGYSDVIQQADYLVAHPAVVEAAR